jgi:hypothetical protein
MDMPKKRNQPYPHLTLAQEVKRLKQWEKNGKDPRKKNVELGLSLTSSKRTRGRPKKGILSLGPEGKILRVKEHYVPAHAIENPGLRGKAAKAWDFICILKERAPLVYVYLLDELSKPARSRELRLQIIEQEFQREYPSRFKVPPKRLLTYIMERAFHGMWEKYGITAPYSGGKHEAFYTGYVYGHAGAIQAYRKILREPKPWPREHVGHDLRFYLGNRGDAVHLRYPQLLEANEPWCVLDIVEEQ